MYPKICLMNLASEFIPQGCNIKNIKSDLSYLNLRGGDDSIIIVEYKYKDNDYTMILSNEDSKWGILNIYDTIGVEDIYSFRIAEQKFKSHYEVMTNMISNGMNKNNYMKNQSEITQNNKYMNKHVQPKEKIPHPIPIVKEIPKSKYYLPDNILQQIKAKPNMKMEEIDGQLVIDYVEADINKDGIPDKVYLVGSYEQKESEIVKNIKLIVKYSGTSDKEVINFTHNSGYRPHIAMYNFQGDDNKNIYVSIFSPEVGGYAYYYIFSYDNGKLKEIFDYDEYNKRNKFKARFIDNYKVEIISEITNKRYLLDLSGRSKEYLSQIYDNDGKVKIPFDAHVTKLNYMYPIDLDADTKYDLDSFNRVTGINGSDTLGYIESFLLWNGKGFIPISQYISTYGESIE